jgi:peptidyl-prolyl cis-trans isomerase B (cyclophilin B)
MIKIIVFIAAVLIGLFVVLLMNNNSKTNTTSQNTIASTPAPSVSPTPETKEVKYDSAIIKTSKGDISMSFYKDEAPNTISNFVDKALTGFYDNLIFHRVEDWVIQGGDPLGNGTGGGTIPVEFNSQPFVIGAVGIASRGDGKVQNDSQFFITKKDSEFLNGEYTNFAIVTEGMDVVEQIEIGDAILGIDLK